MNKLKLAFIILISFFNMAHAVTFPSSPKEWRIHQQVHVEIKGASEEDKAEAIRYLKSKIDTLDLDHFYIFDDNLNRQPYGKEGIRINYLPITGEHCYETKAITGYEDGPNGTYINPHVIQSIRIGKDCLGGNRNLNDIYWHNVLAHEFFCHAVRFTTNRDGHLDYIRGMPLPLCHPGGSKDELLWTYNDAWTVKRKYSRDKLIRYRRINFKKKDIGKFCYLVKGNKSVSFLIENQSMILPYLDKLDSYRRVVR